MAWLFHFQNLPAYERHFQRFWIDFMKQNYALSDKNAQNTLYKRRDVAWLLDLKNLPAYERRFERFWIDFMKQNHAFE